jgi:hypothetical protein
LKTVLYLLLCSPLLLLMTISSQAQTYTSDTNIADFTALVTSYATFSKYESIDGGCGSPTFIPTAAELASTGCRVYDGTDTSGSLPAGNNWILATFSGPVSTIVVFPNIDHYGSAYDGYQYQIYGSNDGISWTFLYDATTVNPCSDNCVEGGGGEPFTLGSTTGTAPTTVNNVLTPQSIGLPAGCSGTSTPCAVGYIAQFTFGTAYQYYAFGASTEASNSGNADQELSAVGTTATVVQQVNTTIPTVSTFNNAEGSLVQQTLDFSTANGNLSCNGQPGNTCPPAGPAGLTLISTNSMIPSDPGFPPYVIGTPFSTGQCLGRPGNGSGNPCSLYVNACFGGSISQAQADDYYCPSVTVGAPAGNQINLLDTWDPIDPKPDPSQDPGTTISLMDFSPSAAGESWAPAPGPGPNPVCTNPDGTGSSIPPATIAAGGLSGGCDFSDSLIEAYGDQTTTHGSKPKKGWLISVSKIYMPLTKVFVNSTQVNNPAYYTPGFSANLWFNSPFNLSFVVNPACPSWLSDLGGACTAINSAAYNYFKPAPVAGENYSVTTLSGTPVLPLTPAVPPMKFNTQNATPITFTGNPNPVSLPDGQYYLQFGASDNVGIDERSIRVVPAVGGASGNCPVPADAGGGTVPATPQGTCYVTTLFQAQLNMDSTKPTISTTFSTPGSPAGTFYQNETVYPVYTCSDPLSNNVASGINTCAGVLVGGCPATATVNGPALPTSSAGNFTSPAGITSTDCASNMSAAATQLSYIVAPSVNLQINTIPLLSLNTVFPGIPVTYGAAVSNLSNVAADDITVTTTFSTPTTGVVLGNPSATISLVSCSNSPCTLKGITFTTTKCNVTWPTVSCSVPSLGPLSAKTGLWMEIVVPVSNTSKAGTFTSTSTVSSAGLDPTPGNNSVTEKYTIIK